MPTIKKTLLEITQDILADMSSDEVNSIGDTEESEQVARQVEATFYNIINKNIWPHTRQALTVIPRSDNEFPTHMSVEENLRELVSIYYDKRRAGETRTQYLEIKYLDPDDFLRTINRRDSDADNVIIVVDDSGIKLNIMNNKSPDYYTSFNDEDLVFDSYDSDIDGSLQQSKCQAIGYVTPQFQMVDTYVPDLPVDAFSLLIEEATARCQFKIRQLVDQKSEQESGRQSRMLSRRNWRVNGETKFRDYGKRR